MQDSRHASAMQEPSTSASLAIGVPEPAFTTVLASEGRSSPGTSSTRQHPSPSTRPSLTVPDSFREHRVGRHSPGPSPSPSVVRLSHVSSMFQRLSHFSTAGSGSRSCDGSVRKSSAISASLHSFFGAASRSSPIQRHSVLLTSWATDLPQAPRKTENESKKSKKHTLIFDDVVSATKYAKDDQLKDESRFLIMPGSRFLTIWRVVMVYVVLWAVVMAPFELAFSWWDPPEYMLVVSRLVDLFCIADMVMNFFIPIIKFGRMTTDKRSIAIQYLRTWFAIDFFTNIPWDLILSSAGKSRKVVKILKLPKVFRLTRLLRVAREEAHTLGTFFTVCGVLLLAHYFSCLWVALLIDCPDDDTSNAFRCPEIMAAYAQGLSVAMSTLMGSDGWLRFLIESGRTPEISSSGTGFVWMNAGIGVELVAALNCLVGACSLGVLFANIARAMDKQDSHTRLFNQRLRNVKQAIAQHGLPYEIYDRANKHFHYVWSCGTDSSRSLLNDEALSLDLRRELAYNLYGDLLRKVPFLAPAESQLLKQLCRHAVLEVFSPKDIIVVAGEVGLNLFFLLTGSVVCETQDGSLLRKLEEGSFFGEIALFFQECAHKVNIVGVTFGWILVVHRDVLLDLCSEELLESFRLVALERNDNIHHDEKAAEVLYNWTPKSCSTVSLTSPAKEALGAARPPGLSAISSATPAEKIMHSFRSRLSVPGQTEEEGAISSDDEESTSVKGTGKSSSKPEQAEVGKVEDAKVKNANADPFASELYHALKQSVLEDNSSDTLKVSPSKKFTSLDRQSHRTRSRLGTGPKQFHLKMSLPWLRVHIDRASALPGSPDPYCVCEVPGKALTKHSTKVISGTANPEWNEAFEIQNFLKDDDLQFTAFSKDLWRGCDSVLGKAALKSSDFFPEGWQGELELLDIGDQDQRSFLHLRIEVFGLGNASTTTSAPPDILVHNSEGNQTRCSSKEKLLVPASACKSSACSSDQPNVAAILEARLEAKLSHWSKVIDERLSALEAQGGQEEAVRTQDLTGSISQTTYEVPREEHEDTAYAPELRERTDLAGC